MFLGVDVALVVAYPYLGVGLLSQPIKKSFFCLTLVCCSP
jgi:hypothetical protein